MVLLLWQSADMGTQTTSRDESTKTWQAVDRYFDEQLMAKRRRERSRLERLWNSGSQDSRLAQLLMRRVGN